MDFPDNRTAQVRVNNTFSRMAAFTCGVPQGSVLGPLLFIIVMDSLSAELNKIPDLDHAFFTDDLTLLTASNDKDVIQRTLQHALEVVESCTKTHYMELSAPKTKYTLFGARNWNELTLFVGETQIGEDRHPRLLGVDFNPMRDVSMHLASTFAAASCRLGQLRAMVGETWGPSKDVVRSFFLALIHSKLTYAATAWWDNASATHQAAIERLHRRGASIITGVGMHADANDLMKEGDLLPIDSTVNIQRLRLYLSPITRGGYMADLARSVYLPDHCIHNFLIPVRGSFSAIDPFEAPHTHRSLLKYRRALFNTSLPGNLCAVSSDEKLATCERRLERFRNVPFALYTDGAVVLDERSGAAAMLYDQRGLVKRCTTSCGKYACSYRAECMAMEVGLEMLLEHATERRVRYTTAVIVTDSYSLLMVLQTGPTTVEEGILRRIWTLILRLINRRVRLSFQFVFGHCNLTRNEDVDKLVKACMASDVTSRA